MRSTDTERAGTAASTWSTWAMRATFASAALVLSACSDQVGQAGQGGDLHASFPLFTNLSEEQFDQSCLDFRAEVRAVRKQDDELLKTAKSDELAWSADIQAAIEKATKADKPIYLVTFVRENGDPHCDV